VLFYASFNSNTSEIFFKVSKEFNKNGSIMASPFYLSAIYSFNIELEHGKTNVASNANDVLSSLCIS
jgi:hypothetical protein